MKFIPEKLDVFAQFIAVFFILAMISKIWWLDAICYYKILILTLMKIKAKIGEVTQKLNTTSLKNSDD